MSLSLLGANCVLLHQENDVHLHGIVAWLIQALLHFAVLLCNWKWHPTDFFCNPIAHIFQAMVFVFPDFKAQCLNYGHKKKRQKERECPDLSFNWSSYWCLFQSVITRTEMTMQKWPFPTNSLCCLCVFGWNLQTFVDTSLIASHIYFPDSVTK